jgi:hypothetical protein
MISVISPKIVEDLRPPQLGYQPLGVAGGGSLNLPTYGVRLRIGGHDSESPWMTFEVVCTTPATPGADMIIGMDVLMKCNLRWNGPIKGGSIAC